MGFNLLCCEDLFGKHKYPNLAGVVTETLCLSHGSAHVARGFSVSGKIISEQRVASSSQLFEPS